MSTSSALPLSVLDAGFIGASAYPIDFLFVYERGLKRAALQRGLDQVLHDFPVLKSQLDYDEAQRCFVFVPRSDARIVIDEREAGAGDGPLVAPVQTLPGEPLLRIVLTRGADHDTLGVSMSHAVADGRGYFAFLSAWCATLRGQSYPRPDHDRAVVDALAAIDDEGAAPLSPDEFFDRTGITWLSRRRDVLGTAPSRREPLCPPPPPVDGASESAVLAAACLRRFVVRRDPPAVRLSCAIDLRRRVPRLTPHFFGNASLGASRRWSRAAYDQESDAAIARQLHAAVVAWDSTAAGRAVAALRSLLRQEGADVASFLHTADPDRGIMVTDLSRLPLASLDCGVGPPRDFAIATRAPGTVVLTRRSGALECTIIGLDAPG